MDSRRDYQPEDPEVDGPPTPTQADLEAMFEVVPGFRTGG
jgi:hypothetical protein